jgi:hypothetical protein
VALYWTAAGLAALRPTEGGFTQIHNSVPGGATGGYGFLDSTWRTFAPQAGDDINQYPRAALAPADVQSRVAAITPISNWTCPGCNSSAVALAQVPGYVTSTPGAAVGSSGFDPNSLGATAPSSSYVAAPDGFSSGLTAGDPGSSSSVDLGAGVGNVLPSGSAAVDLSLSPDLQALTTTNAATPGNALDFVPGSALSLGDQLSLNAVDGTNVFAGQDALLGTSTGAGGSPLGAASSGASAASGASFFNWLTTEVTDLLVRFGVIILGLILLGIAAYQFAKEKEA